MTLFKDIKVGEVFRPVGSSIYYMRIPFTHNGNAVALNSHPTNKYVQSGMIDALKAKDEVVTGGWVGLSTDYTCRFGF